MNVDVRLVGDVATIEAIDFRDPTSPPRKMRSSLVVGPGWGTELPG
jgi:hypothetical protein